MDTLSERLDNHLIDLCWSMWTELGVAGVKRRHQDCLIALEELILLTAVLAEVDPRLRDEALDWCSRYHDFISISRLKALARSFGAVVTEPLSRFSAALNAASRAHWPQFIQVPACRFVPSGKSQLSPLERPSLLYLRLRKLFGIGARADVIAFFLEQQNIDFAAADVVEIGYSKRNIVDVLDGFVEAGIFEVSKVRNQQRYFFIKRAETLKLLGRLPKFLPAWRHVFHVLLLARACIQRTKKKSESTKVIEMQKTLSQLGDALKKLHLSPPIMQTDFQAYWRTFGEWILSMTISNFYDNTSNR